ncbi:MAG TPA: alpha/beta hydrolase [Syntrophales bacterium]|nr:alpha/beta hydrolase [Syntrophales bacterium]
MTSRTGMGRSRTGAESARQPAGFIRGHVKTGGLRLHYLDYGTEGRPAVLCLHGCGAHAHWFDFIAGGLSPDYHVLAMDQRGHGDSAWADPPDYSYERYAADLAEAVDRLGLRDFTLLGHSMGGTVSLLYAATYPGRAGRLIVADTTLHIPQNRIVAMRDVGLREGGRYDSLEEFVERYRLFPAATTAPPEVIAHLARNSARRSDDGVWRNKVDRNVYASRYAMDCVPLWKRIGIPALLLKGARSARITPEIAAEVKAGCPQVEFAEVPESDHHVTLDNPSGFVDAVRPFLCRHS